MIPLHISISFRKEFIKNSNTRVKCPDAVLWMYKTRYLQCLIRINLDCVKRRQKVFVSEKGKSCFGEYNRSNIVLIPFVEFTMNQDAPAIKNPCRSGRPAGVGYLAKFGCVWHSHYFLNGRPLLFRVSFGNLEYAFVGALHFNSGYFGCDRE